MADDGAEIRSLRRFYLLKRRAAADLQDFALAGVWESKQSEQTATPLPEGFPHLGRLADLGYTATEDLNGAAVHELEDAGFNSREAGQILSALSDLI